ncbi:MarR family winged helix-turn-helix transcriptional regulator [Ancylobacter oerskovii]|uniref:MarR family winged helix-turn-helix transcriptional regulator n=1 Tax=Ancylobacter oerskovii TaxID=459519 RepID=A0ABW4YU59_9HYPH|nr:MarR family transcriptional regulator [Ancylobacter oerskovii]MBS7543764.1 MarR family transcriptional regulator [Ancylobacter oerskovii]
MKGHLDQRNDPPAPAGAGLDDFLCFAVYSANHAFNRAYQPLLEALGLTYPQYLVMVSLWRADGQTVGEIAGRLDLESSTLTPLIKRLEAMGLVTRRRSLEDGRQVHVHLTGEGQALEARAASVPAAIGEATGFDRRAVERLRADMARLRAALRR